MEQYISQVLEQGEGDEWKTAFSTSTGHYQYLVLPYGLATAPSIFQAHINEVLREYLGRSVIPYIDDIPIYSSSWNQHVQDVWVMLQTLLSNLLYCKVETCEFHYREAGQVDSRGGKVFRGATFITAPVLQQPNLEKPFVVEVDASDTGVGAVLSQRTSERGGFKPVAYFSWKLSLAEWNHGLGDHKLLAMKSAFEDWGHWLEGVRHPFTVYTDHKNLEYLQTNKETKC
ncbi:hypothetical protein P4O66_002583 [Electrophorus voltai]|uniref:ribonuclease H n=1 Tax=Electrophorus voltai TaxID=2609070 RepID=A0AAD9DN32_9TELE|nr:hypothetical protein P4O66_002583 [Electrophorus voltai]